MSDSLKKKLVIFLIVLVSVILSTAVEYFGVLNSPQEKIYDRFFIKSEPSKEILIVGIDDVSLAELGQWPWPREFFGRAIENLDGAEFIGIDVLFSEDSRLGPLDDLSFSQSLKNSGSKVVLAKKFDDRGNKVVEPVGILKNSALTGFINVELGSDGVARAFKTEFEEGEHLSKLLSGKESPESLRIAYTGKTKTFPNISFVDVYNGKIPESVISDKKILIGATAQDLQDILDTPFGRMPGVEVLGNALHTIEGGKYFKEVPFPILCILISLVALTSAVSSFYLKNFAALFSVLLVELVLINISSLFLFSKYILLPNIPLNLSFLIVSSSIISYQYITESKEKRFIRKTFEYYLMPEVINELILHPEGLRLGGEKRKVTILFSDIRGFTTLSEKLTPEGLTEILNEYLTEMTEAIMKKKGLVDKYIGDAIMAFWGAPVKNENQAKDACESVLEMMERLEVLNKSLTERNLPNISIGVGLNTGEVVVGNMGSKNRFNYSLLGDEVNFASRLEGLNKPYGVKCIVSESVKKEIEDDQRFKTRELDYVVVKGKKEPKKIYELITKEVDKNVLGSFESGREFYYKGEFQKAIGQFEKILSMDEDNPSKLLLERSKNLLKNPPKDWKGVYEFETK